MWKKSLIAEYLPTKTEIVKSCLHCETENRPSREKLEVLFRKIVVKGERMEQPPGRTTEKREGHQDRPCELQGWGTRRLSSGAGSPRA